MNNSKIPYFNINLHKLEKTVTETTALTVLSALEKSVRL